MLACVSVCPLFYMKTTVVLGLGSTLVQHGLILTNYISIGFISKIKSYSEVPDWHDSWGHATQHSTVCKEKWPEALVMNVTLVTHIGVNSELQPNLKGTHPQV